VVRGGLSFRLDCQPAFNYAQDKHTTEISAGGACFRSSKLSLGLATRIRLERNGTGVSAEFTLREGQTAVFVLQEMAKGAGCGITLAEEEAEELLRKTVEYRRRWLSKCTYKVKGWCVPPLSILTVVPGFQCSYPWCSQLDEGNNSE